MTNTTPDPAAHPTRKGSPIGVFAALLLAFAVATAATGYFCRTMSDGMPMPGGWTMSMTWMRMPGQGWAVSGSMFMAMWAAMMTAMMLPSSLPVVLAFHRDLKARRYNRPTAAALLMYAVYTLVWCVVGAGVYVVGVAMAELMMRSDPLARRMPVVFAGGVALAGVWQFLPCTGRALGCCRTLDSCGASTSAFGHGVERGIQCVTCCAGPMLAMLAMGMMNPFVIVAAGFVIATEKLLPRPRLTSVIVGSGLVCYGVLAVLRVMWGPS